MRFHILVVEPTGYKTAHFLYDLAKLVLGGLEQAGHPTTIAANTLEPRRTNVIVGGHLLPESQVHKIVGSGTPYVVAQSEVLHAEGMNHQGQPAHLKKVVLPLLRGAQGVWDLCRRNLPVLEGHDIPAQWLTPGWVPHLEDVPRRAHKDYDFLFYGSVTPHRRSIFQALRGRGYRVKGVFDPVALYRNDLIARSTLQLVPRQTGPTDPGRSMAQLPWTRIVHQIHNRAVPVVEECEDQAWLQDSFLWAPSAAYLDYCEQVLARGPEALEAHAEAAYFALRTRPMSQTIERLLDTLNPGPPPGLELAAV